MSGFERLIIETETAEVDCWVEVARTNEEHERGLMGRTNLPERFGMLFMESRPVAKRMWMRGTPIPLDIVFIDPDWRILRIEHSAAPESEKMIWSFGLSQAVLELPGGTCRSLGIEKMNPVSLAR